MRSHEDDTLKLDKKAGGEVRKKSRVEEHVSVVFYGPHGGNMSAPLAKDVKVFVPAKEFDRSRGFYEALGWRENWHGSGLSELELAGVRFYLQDYYAKEWAENFMLYVVVESAETWWEHATNIIRTDEWKPARVAKPRQEPYGALVTYVWDPSGVLIHFAQPDDS